MKIVQKIIFSTLILFGSTHVHAGKDRNVYKVPDLQQQQQRAQWAEKYLQKITAKPAARFERRHQSKSQAVDPSTRQKMLALFFMSLIGNAEIIHSISLVSNKTATTSQPQSRNQFEKSERTNSSMPLVRPIVPIRGLISYEELKSLISPLVQLVPYHTEKELETYGPCERQRDGSKFCCNIGQNYTVTCCLHPSIAPGLSRCVFFDPVGIVGDQLESPSATNIMADLLEAADMCTNAYDIAEEVQHTLATKSEFGVMYANQEFLAHNIPTLTKTIKELTQKFHVDTMPQIIILGDPDDRPSLEDFSTSIDLYDVPPRLKIYINFVKYFADKQQEGVYAHELQHAKQPHPKEHGIVRVNTITHNNFEIEADIASVLATGTLCMTVLLRDEVLARTGLSTIHTMGNALQNINKDIITSELAGLCHNEHPDEAIRMLVTYSTYKKLEKVRNLLGLNVQHT